MTGRIVAATRQRALELAQAGLSRRAIGRELGISHSTVGNLIRAAAPFGAGPEGGRPNIPPANYGADQTPPPPEPLGFRPGYHDRTFRNPSGLLGFEDWSLERVRNAIALHDQGMFLESSVMAIVITRFAPVFAALGQAIAPALALPRHVRGGERGLGRMLREEIEAQLAPRFGLRPSPFFPVGVWGAIAVELRLMGFAVLQHVYGEPDEETGVRPLYTRRWPTWATTYYRHRKTFVANTTEGPIDIVSGDGKFTLIADTEEPHFDGAIRALGLETLDGSLVKQARASYIDKYGNPKWWVEMPQGTKVRSPEGEAMFEAIAELQGPDGIGVFPHGGKLSTAQMSGGQNNVFDSAGENVWRFVAAVLLGSDGTISPGQGVYSAPIFAGVRRDLIDRMLKAIVRGVNMGHVAPFLQLNYAASIANDNSGWVEPVLDIPLPDPDADARIESYGKRVEKLHALIKGERDAGCVMTQERVNQLAGELEVAPPKLSQAAQGKPEIYAYELEMGIFTINEARARKDEPPRGVDETVPERDARLEREIAEAEKEAEAQRDIDVDEAAGDKEQPPAPPPIPEETPAA